MADWLKVSICGKHIKEKSILEISVVDTGWVEGGGKILGNLSFKLQNKRLFTNNMHVGYESYMTYSILSYEKKINIHMIYNQ